MKTLLTLQFILLGFLGWSQNQISLQDCYKNLEDYYPIAKQLQLYQSQNSLELEAINSRSLPQLVFNAQVTYYSEVTQVPIPNAGITPLNNDQYKTSLSAQQFIFKGGEIQASKDLQNTLGGLRAKEVEVQLNQLKLQLNQVYFSILALDQQLALVREREKQLNQTLVEVKSSVENGVLLASSDRIITIELLKIQSFAQELQAKKMRSLELLSSMIGINIDENTQLMVPLLDQNINSKSLRPEIELFHLKKDEISMRSSLLNTANTPTLLGFATAGYGNPGLNMLKNSFEDFYIVGLQLNWKTFDWNFNKKKRAALEINKEIINTQEEVFQLRTSAELEGIQAEINSLNEQIKNDALIIDLQESVLTTMLSQLKNGIITSSVYITESTNLFEANNRLIQHQNALELAKANYNLTKGKNESL